MKFVIISNDGERVLCQFADMAPMIWIDARVAEAIGYSYALHYETRRGAERGAFIHNGAVLALGDWDNDAETSREVGRGCTCGRVRAQVARGTEPGPNKVGRGVARGGPGRSVQAGAAVRSDRGTAGRPVARLAPVVAADWRERSRDARLAAAAEWDELARTGWA